MKKHYWDYHSMTKQRTACGLQTVEFKHISKHHMEITCLKCIKAMSPNDRKWHDKNNKEWIAHAGIKKGFWASLFGL